MHLMRTGSTRGGMLAVFLNTRCIDGAVVQLWCGCVLCPALL